MLATVGAEGSPNASYVPFAPFDAGLAIVVSRLAAHTANLMTRARSSALIVSDDVEPSGAYARPRIAIEVTARPAPTDSQESAAVWTALEARHGELVATLRMLPDFQPIVLVPQSARLVLGFASAHDLDASETLTVVRTAAMLNG